MKIKPNYKLDLQLFAEDNPEEQTPPTEEVDPTKKFLDEIANLKANSVDKKKYEELEQQNKTLLDTVLNGGSFSQVNPEKEEKPDIKKLRESLFKEENSNLEYAKKALALRKAIMDEGGIDPFVPVGEKVIPEQSDFDAAKRVADVLQDCIDASEGDSGVFTSLLQSKTVEAMPQRPRKR